MAVTFNIPAGDTLYSKELSTFLGIDYSNDPGNVDESRSPWAPNMIRSAPGKVRKCMGYQKMASYTGRINGAHTLRTGQEGTPVYNTLIHAGTTLVRQDTGAVVYSAMADERSRSWQIKDALWIQDGKNLLKAARSSDGTLSITSAAESPYVPTMTINKNPAGGGTSHEALNLITPRFKELFYADGTSTTFYLSYTNLDTNIPVVVKVLNASTSAWDTKTEGIDYTVNRTAGTVTFMAAPAKSASGASSVEIEAGKTVAGYADRVLKCTVGILYGVSGMPDRLFISGNPAYTNYDWYSGQYDPSYWPDTGYAVLGSAASAVMGYAIVGNYLAAYKDRLEPDRNIIFRQGTLSSTSEPEFPIYNTLAGPGTISKWGFGQLENEPLNLTPQGVYALTTSDVTGERYAQNRSWYADGKMLKLAGLNEAYACVFHSMYWLCADGQAYILDGIQAASDRSKPYSTRLYAAFHRTNLPARVMWTGDAGETLWFGSEAGNVYRFFSAEANLASYTDDGAQLGGSDGCCWTTPDYAGKIFYQNKTFRWIAVQLQAAAVTGVDIFGMKRGEWIALKSDHASPRYLDFNNLDFNRLTFSGDQTNRTIHSKTRLKNVDKVRYKFENNAAEPFGLMAYGIDYTEPGGHYKR